MAFISIGGVSLKSLINYGSNRFWSHVVLHLVLAVQLSSAALAVLTTRPTCYSFLALCLASLEESLPWYPVAEAVSVVPGDGTRMHTPAYSASEAHNGPPDSIPSNEPKPLEKHRTPPL
ncbi:hypothetical protein Tco_1342527 [Tanacetum coccineum]